MSDADLRQSFRTRLRTVAALPVIAPANRDFTPPAVGYLTDAVLFGTHTLRTFPASRGEVERAGIYQIDVYLPQGTGPAAMDGLAQDIEDAFRPGDAVTTADASRPAYITATSRSDFGPDRQWVRTMIRVAWRHMTANQLTSA